MSLRIEWTLFALERVEVLSDFLARKSPAAAERAINDLFDRVGLLGEQPEMGHVLHVVDDPTIRQMYFGAYRVLYLVDRPGGAVFVLAVQHGKEAPYRADELAQIVDLASATKGS